jgi:prepilin-type N-terminal cleavage/methylation domain-containing protein
MKKTQAFTLIEILIVIAIIGLMAAIVVPAVRRASDKNNSSKSTPVSAPQIPKDKPVGAPTNSQVHAPAE